MSFSMFFYLNSLKPWTPYLEPMTPGKKVLAAAAVRNRIHWNAGAGQARIDDGRRTSRAGPE